MSKYLPLWEFVKKRDKAFLLSFEEAEKILSFPLDHSFLNYKKELSEYGWRVGKISIKNSTVSFIKE